MILTRIKLSNKIIKLIDKVLIKLTLIKIYPKKLNIKTHIIHTLKIILIQLPQQIFPN